MKHTTIALIVGAIAFGCLGLAVANSVFVYRNASRRCEVAETVISLNPLEKLVTRSIESYESVDQFVVKIKTYLGGDIEVISEGCGGSNRINRKRDE